VTPRTITKRQVERALELTQHWLKVTRCRCGHAAGDHWRSNGKIQDCAVLVDKQFGKYCSCKSFKEKRK
jgi:hypothetical protein